MTKGSGCSGLHAALLLSVALAMHGPAAQAQAAAPQTAGVTAPAKVLVAHGVPYALSAALVRGSSIAVERVVATGIPASRQTAFLTGRGAAPLQASAGTADAVITLRSLWAEDPLYPFARRHNIRIVEIDAARPIDNALPGIALSGDSATQLAAYPWLDPVNLGRMADVIASELGRLSPAAQARLATNLADIKQRIVRATADAEAVLARAENVSVLSLSERLNYLANGFNLDLAGVDARDDEAWSAEAVSTLGKTIKSQGIAAVLHHRAPPPTVAQAISASGARLIVLATEGEDPIADLQANARLLTQLSSAQSGVKAGPVQ